METTTETTLETSSFFVNSLRLNGDLKTVAAEAIATVLSKKVRDLKLVQWDVIRFPNKTWWQIDFTVNMGQYTDLRLTLVRYSGKNLKMDGDFSKVSKIGRFKLWIYRTFLGLKHPLF